MEWYVPLTVLPAVALIILSTSNFLIALNSEIDQLERTKDVSNWVINQKIKQLNRLGYTIILLYSSTLFLMFSALEMAIYKEPILFNCLMVFAVLLFTAALILLFTFSLKAIKIRQRHLKN